MHRTNRRPGLRCAALALAALPLLASCASDSGIPREFSWVPPEESVHARAPQSGEALMRHKRQLQRAERELVHFHRTLMALRHRSERGSSLLLASFLDAYLGLHLDPLLEGDWQSKHPELVALDANLRLLKAETLIAMRDPGRAENVLDDLERRYEGRRDLFIQYPLGDASTLGEAVERLRDKKWWRG